MKRTRNSVRFASLLLLILLFTAFSASAAPPAHSGKYLVYVQWNKPYYDWKWVEVKDNTQLSLNFIIDPALVGNLEVMVPEKSVKSQVDVIPLDGDGKVPEHHWMTIPNFFK